MPRIPVIKAVPIFRPIWKLKKEPIAFIITMSNPPKIELPINLAILFRGNIKNLPIKNKKRIEPT